MAKIGTAHIEIKPVIDEAALDTIVERVAAAVAEGVARGMRDSNTGGQSFWQGLGDLIADPSRADHRSNI